jgi:SpoIVB peptidase S55
MRRLSLLLFLLLIGALAPAAQAAPPAVCPTVMPIDEVATASGAPDGFDATGWTVSRGIEPEEFGVKVLGVLDDGVAVGTDMIIVETSGPALDRAGGIWAGMSGSPVYADDGRLIGAVAYGLSFGPSKLGGLTPAGNMVDVLDIGAPAQVTRIPSALRQKIVASGAATARQLASGLQRLKVPLSVSGLSSGRLDKFAERMAGKGQFIPFAAGAAAAPPTGDLDEIVPGGNFAAAFSYGDITAGGVGTTTAVCDERAVAFGHPLNFDGPTALSAHNATAITIQDDPAGSPFKIANIGGTVGTLDQDRLAAIRALLGDAPDPIAVTSTVSEAGGPDDAGLTNVNRTNDVPDIAAFHLIGNVDDVVDRVSGGRAQIGWTVRGKANGKPFSLTRNNKFADSSDITFFAVDEMFLMLATIAQNPFTEVTFDDVKIDADVQFPYRAYRIKGVEQRVGTDWEPVEESLTVDPGATIRLRVLLIQDRSTAPIAPVELSFKVPADAGGREGSIEIMGGGGGGGEEGPPTGGSGEPETFEQLIDQLGKLPRNDQITADFRFFSEEESTAVASIRKDTAEVVSGGTSVSVTVSGGETPCGEEVPCEPEPSGPNLNVGGKSSFKLATALKRGMKLTLRTSEAGRATVKAYVDRKTARRLKINRKAKGPVVVAAATKRVHSGRNTVKLVFTKKARKRLKHATRVKLSVRASIRSAEGNRATDRFSLTLKKKLR